MNVTHKSGDGFGLLHVQIASRPLSQLFLTLGHLGSRLSLFWAFAEVDVGAPIVGGSLGALGWRAEVWSLHDLHFLSRDKSVDQIPHDLDGQLAIRFTIWEEESTVQILNAGQIRLNFGLPLNKLVECGFTGEIEGVKFLDELIHPLITILCGEVFGLGDHFDE